MSYQADNSTPRIRFGHDEGIPDDVNYALSPPPTPQSVEPPSERFQRRDPATGRRPSLLGIGMDSPRFGEERYGPRYTADDPYTQSPPARPPPQIRPLPAAFVGRPQYHFEPTRQNESPRFNPVFSPSGYEHHDDSDQEGYHATPPRQSSPPRRASPPSYPPPPPIVPLFSRGAPSRPPRPDQPTFQRKDSNETLYEEPSFPPAPKWGASNRDAPPSTIGANGQPIKPTLRRSSTEEHLRTLAARQAINVVQSHTREFDRWDRPSRRDQDEENGYPQRSDPGRGAGVLSNLLKLYGNNQQGLRRSNSVGTASSWGGTSRASSMDEKTYADSRPPIRRSQSEASVATSFNEPLDPDDPRATAADRPQTAAGATRMNRHNSYSSEGHPEAELRSRKKKDAKRASKTEKELKEEDAVRDAMQGKPGKKGKSKKHRKTLEITAHVADILQRQNFLLKLAKALMTFGAPSHRLESQLNATATVLHVDAQFIHIPSVVIASFGDIDTHTSETKFVKASGGLNLGLLHDVHGIYRAVVHDEIGVEEGSIALTRMLRADPIYNLWQRMIIAGICAGTIAPMGFGGSFVDGWVAGGFGAMLAFLQLYAAKKNAIFSNIFEITIAALISFTSRGLSTTDYFCYEALSSAGVVLVLPGYIILCGSLELASKNLVAGSVRMVYAIIYTLFLGFSISIGSELWYLVDPKSKHDAAAAAVNTYTLDGTFAANNASQSFAGSWTFTNSTSSGTSTQASLQQGNVMCYRDPSWEWWRQSVDVYWLILLVPAFSLALSLWNLQPIRSKELPVMVTISIIGFLTNRLATTYIFNRSDIVSFIGATVIGLLGNMYSRVFHGTSFTAMATGVLFLVPSGIAAAGGLAMSSSTQGGDSYSSGLTIGFRMVQVSIGITVGLFFSSFIVYSIGSKGRSGSLGFAF